MKIFKKVSLLSILLISLFLTLISCSKTKVVLIAEQNEINVMIGENVDLKLSATEVMKITEQDILTNLDFKSSDDKIIKIEANNITAVGIGTADVTATWKEYDGATVTVKVNVIAPEVGEVTYSSLPEIIYTGDNFSITYIANNDVTVSYTTSNIDILSVDGNNFKALSQGTVKITATATNGYKEIKKEWDVEVIQPEYNITYVLNGGINDTSNPTTYDIRELPLAISPATHNHKTFLGWTVEGNSKDYIYEIPSGSTGDITLYAQYKDITHNIVYNLDGGRLPKGSPFKYVEGEITQLVIPTKEGYIFLGWSTEIDSNTYITEIGEDSMGQIKVYAHWKRENTFAVIYDLDGGVSTESYLQYSKPAATLEVNNYNYNEGAYWSGTNYKNNVFLGQSGYDPTATFSDRIYIGKDSITGLWVVLDIINSGPSSWAEGAEYVLTISNSHNNKGTLHSIVVNSIKVGQVVAFSCNPIDMNHSTPGNVYFYNDAPTESIIKKDVTPDDTLISPSKLGYKFDGWYDENGKKYETIADLTTDVKLIAKWIKLTDVTDIQIDSMTLEMITGDTFQIIANVLPTDAYFQDVIYTSSDPDIISVSETGLMTAVNAGTCTITIRDYMSYAVKTYTVTVYSIPSIDVDFEDEFDGILSVGEKVQIHAHSLGKDTDNTEIYYESSNTSIATVDETGFVTALKEGEVIITVSDNTGSNYEVKIQLIVADLATETKVDQVLKLITEYNFAIVDAGNVCLYNDGTQRYYDSMYGSVNYFLFAPYVVEEKYYANSDAITDNSNHKDRRAEDTIEFVTVHDTATLTGTVHSIASSMSTGGTSIHYTTGNGEIVGVVREKYRAYHARDGTYYSFSWLATGIKVGEKTPEFDMVKNGSAWYLTIDGQVTSISLPVSNGTKTIANPSKAHFSTLGPSYKVIDGYYYVAPFRVDFSQVAEGCIGNQGGNNNSVGIEMCVNVSGDIYDTWQRTGQLVADILIRNGLTLDRVKEHNTWSGKNCPQCIRAGSYWNEFMKMVEVNYIFMKDYKDAKITFKSNNPDIVNEIGRVINPPKTTTTVSYDVTVTIDGVSKTITLYSVIPGTTCWTQWDGSYPSSLIWNNGKFGKIF